MRADATTIDELTVRQALMTLGLTGRAHEYPEWVCAEAWLFMALRIGQRVTAVAGSHRSRHTRRYRSPLATVPPVVLNCSEGPSLPRPSGRKTRRGPSLRLRTTGQLRRSIPTRSTRQDHSGGLLRTTGESAPPMPGLARVTW
jgi:hypothetical protein